MVTCSGRGSCLADGSCRCDITLQGPSCSECKDGLIKNARGECVSPFEDLSRKPVAVELSLVFDVDVLFSSAATLERFKASFVLDIAMSLGISASRVTVSDVRIASRANRDRARRRLGAETVIVAFTIDGVAEEQPGSETEMSALSAVELLSVLMEDTSSVLYTGTVTQFVDEASELVVSFSEPSPSPSPSPSTNVVREEGLTTDGMAAVVVVMLVFGIVIVALAVLYFRSKKPIGEVKYAVRDPTVAHAAHAVHAAHAAHTAPSYV